MSINLYLIRNFYKLKCLIFFVVYFFSFSSFTQNKKFIIPDSLKNKSYREILKRFNNSNEDVELSRLYARVYLKKGKDDNEKIHIARGYRLHFILENNYHIGIKYLDSAIQITKDFKGYRYPAILFMNKGMALYGKGKYEQALTNFLKAIDHSKISDNENYVYFNLHNIGLLKRSLGEYKESIDIFKKCYVYDELRAKNTLTDSASYVITGIELAKTFTLNKQIDSSKYYIEKSRPFLPPKKDGVYYSLLYVEGLNEYYKKNYYLSIEKLDKTIAYALKNSMILYSNEKFFPEAYYYLAKNYEEINDNEKSMLVAKKIDSCFDSDKLPSKEVRKALEMLIKYNKKHKNAEMQLFYIEKLLSIDSLLLKDYKALNKSINKEFDTPNLLNEKEEVILNLKEDKKKFNIWLVITLVLFFLLLNITIFYYRRQRVFKKRFENLINEKQKKIVKAEGDKVEKKSININDDILGHILDELDSFESKKSFLTRKITLSSLAKEFNTNPRYLSLVVNDYKLKSFTNYLTDLRIDYAIQKLKTDKTFRKYSVKAIAFDVGFNNTQSFSNAFYKKTGIYPSYFIKKLNEIIC
jgi:AraC-like DNA-binding protein